MNKHPPKDYRWDTSEYVTMTGGPVRIDSADLKTIKEALRFYAEGRHLTYFNAMDANLPMWQRVRIILAKQHGNIKTIENGSVAREALEVFK